MHAAWHGSTYSPDISPPCVQAGSGSKAGSQESHCRSLHFDKNPHRPSCHSLVQWIPAHSGRWVSLLKKGNKKKITELKWFIFMESSLHKNQEARVLVKVSLLLKYVIWGSNGTSFNLSFPMFPWCLDSLITEVHIWQN